ncbi:MAG: hypothetical protein ACXADO_10935, partial [Candidatus Thorarchaeota archaeon]
QLVGYQIESASESIYALTAWVQTASNTTIIWDRIVFDYSGVEDGRIDVSTIGYTWWVATYEYGGQEITSGLTATLNGSKILSWDGIDSRWEYSELKGTVQLVGYHVDSASESAYGLTAWTQTASDTTIIWDQIEFYDSGVVDGRVDVNAEGRPYWYARYDYDDQEITSGLTAMLNGSKALSWDSTGSFWDYTETKSSVQLAGYHVASASESTYGLSAWIQTASNVTIIWDRMVFHSSGVVDGRIDINAQGETWWNAKYEYDNEEIASGLTAYLNGSKQLLWDAGNTRWYYLETESSVQLTGYQIESATESTYGLTAWTQISLDTSIIWDRIEFYQSGVTDGRIDVNTEGSTWWKVRYDYDDQDIISGFTGALNDSKLLVWNSISSYWDYNETSAIVELVGYHVASASESTYGLTAWTQTGGDTSIIWDRIEFYDSTVVDSRIDVTTEGSTRWRARFDYDNQEISSGLTAELNGSKSLTWNSIASHWEHNETMSSVELVGYHVISASESSYGLSVWTQTASATTIVWDRIEFYQSGVVDGRIDVGSEGSTWWKARYDYDGQEITEGLTALLNGSKPLTWNSISSLWDYNETRSTVELVGYEIMSASESTYDLSTFVQTANDEAIIWDRIRTLTTSATDGRIDYGTTTTVNVTAELEYDGMLLDSGDMLYMNNTAMTWDTDHFYLIVGPLMTVDKVTFYVNSSNANEDLYGITVVYVNGKSDIVIWDRVLVKSYSTDDERIDVGAACAGHVNLSYEFDNAPVTDGFVAVNGVSATYSGSEGIWDFSETRSTVQTFTYDNVEVSDNENGITVVNQNAQSVKQIWDQLRVISYTVTDERCNINSFQTITAIVIYEYDSILFIGSSGTVYLNNTAMVWDSVEFNWNQTRSSPSVIRHNFVVTSITDSLYGLSA